MSWVLRVIVYFVVKHISIQFHAMSYNLIIIFAVLLSFYFILLFARSQHTYLAILFSNHNYYSFVSVVSCKYYFFIL